MLSSEDRGFTLIEVLVALTIMIAIATLLYRGFSSALRLSAVSDRSEAALLIAKARLADVGAELPLEGGRVDGVEGNMAWTVEVRPRSAGDQNPIAGLAPFWATVSVTWSERSGQTPRTLQLTTLKLAPPK